MNSPFKEERFGQVQVPLPVLKQSLGRPDVGLLLLSGSQSQGAVIGYTAQPPSAGSQLCLNASPIHESVPVLTVSALREASSPEVGQSQPDHVAELLKLGGFIDTRCFVPLAQSAGNKKEYVKESWRGLPALIWEHFSTLKLGHSCPEQTAALLLRRTEAVPQLWVRNQNRYQRLQETHILPSLALLLIQHRSI